MAKKSGWSSSSSKDKRYLDPDVVMKYKHDAIIAVGIHEKAPDYQDKNETDLSLIANILEFGTDTIPEYRWLSKSIEMDSAVYTEMFTKALKRSKDNKSQFDLSMDEIGNRAVNAVQQHLENNDIGMPSNKMSTQKRKGGDTPLIASRHLVRNIDFKRET